MTYSSFSADVAWEKTRAAYVWSHLLNTPFWAIFNMLPFILYKDLHATPLQVTAMIVLKPAVSLAAIYWSSLVEKRADRLLSNLIWAKILSHLPFFFFPFIDNPWFFIFSFGIYMLMHRGTVPAWMEVLNKNVPPESRQRMFAYVSAFGYIGGAALPFVLGGLMDGYHEAWRWIFPSVAFISIVSILFKYRIPIQHSPSELRQSPLNQSFHRSISEQIAKPWKSATQLIRRRPDFARYQLGFMLGGSGLIIMQPALPVFFMDDLHLSYTDLAVVLMLCKGIGFALTSSWWARLLSRIDIYRFNSWVTFLAFIFPLCLLAAQIHIGWIYTAYLLYGFMQAGSELSWNLSGPLFAKGEDSSVYSSINVLTVGLRGCFIPIVGSLIAVIFEPYSVMLVGSLLCLLSTAFMSYYSQRVETQHAP